MRKSNLKKLIIIGVKLLTYLMLSFSFMVVMSRVNYALLQRTRTAVVVFSTFMIILVLMQFIYGDFEIGYKKSKPIFLTTMISVFIANAISALSMVVMGILEFPLKDIFGITIVNLLILYIIQAVIVYVMAHLGNSLYFKIYSPENVIIFSKNKFLSNKILKHVTVHDKQYNLIGVFDHVNFEKLSKESVNLVYALGLDSLEENELIEYCYRNNIRLMYNASKYNFSIAKSNSFVIDDVLLIDNSHKEITIGQLFIKRIIDIFGAIVLLIISIPILVVVGIAVKIEDGGTIFFTQNRLTKDGVEFKMYKFRSMKVNHDSRPAEKNDDRITKVGHVIRKLRIDELPQAINILKGDISIVGPRPESVEICRKYEETIPDFRLRLKVKGGLTGYAQIFGKYNTTPEMKLLLDLKYIESFSILEDIKLMLQTLMVFVRSDSTEGFEHGSHDSLDF